MIDNFDLESFLLGILFVVILALIISSFLALREFIRYKKASKRLNESRKQYNEMELKLKKKN